ncbi:hypothetical protein DIPPA_18111 [Diplonema papillatum]|nr:hypothetical protein DIPPA_18111 [Diplonema papillatum]
MVFGAKRERKVPTKTEAAPFNSDAFNAHIEDLKGLMGGSHGSADDPPGGKKADGDRGWSLYSPIPGESQAPARSAKRGAETPPPPPAPQGPSAFLPLAKSDSDGKRVALPATGAAAGGVKVFNVRYGDVVESFRVGPNESPDGIRYAIQGAFAFANKDAFGLLDQRGSHVVVGQSTLETGAEYLLSLADRDSTPHLMTIPCTPVISTRRNQTGGGLGYPGQPSPAGEVTASSDAWRATSPVRTHRFPSLGGRPARPQQQQQKLLSNATRCAHAAAVFAVVAAAALAFFSLLEEGELIPVLRGPPPHDADLPACWKNMEGEVFARAQTPGGSLRDFPLKVGINTLSDIDGTILRLGSDGIVTRLEEQPDLVEVT